MADHSKVLAALRTKLDGDATLIGLIPAGAFKDVAPNGEDKAVIVSKVDHETVYKLGGIAYEIWLVLVKAIHRSKTTETVDQAAARIQALLHDQSLSIDGYTHMLTLVDPDDGVVSYTEADEDSDERWQHSGARYEIWASPN